MDFQQQMLVQTLCEDMIPKNTNRIVYYLCFLGQFMCHLAVIEMVFFSIQIFRLPVISRPGWQFVNIITKGSVQYQMQTFTSTLSLKNYMIFLKLIMP